MPRRSRVDVFPLESAQTARYMPTASIRNYCRLQLGIPGLIGRGSGRPQTELLKQRGGGGLLSLRIEMGPPRMYERAAAIRYEDANARRGTRPVLDRLLLSAWPT